MKIQIDTEKKEIVIEESVKISELFHFLKGIISEDEWDNYHLETKVIYNWSDPIIIEIDKWNPFERPYYVDQPYTIMSQGNGTYQTNPDCKIYNMEIK